MTENKRLGSSNPSTTMLSQASFRDVGGLKTSEGLEVKCGHLFRSGLLRTLTASDHTTLSALGIRALFDLRGPIEKANERHDWSGFGKVPQPLAQIETLAGTQPSVWMQRLRDPDFTPEMARASLLNTYEDMPNKLAPAIKAIAQSLLREEGAPLLVHCTAGKDRTGFVCAMLLTALGVSSDDIMQDYLRANQHVPDLEQVVQRYRAEENVPALSNTMSVIKVLYSAEPAFLNRALVQIALHWGTPEAYLGDMAGLGASEREQLRSNLLTLA